jgi:hypothetical protein
MAVMVPQHGPWQHATERLLWEQAEKDPSPDQMRVLADFHDERGDDALAYALRWAAKRSRWPARRYVFGGGDNVLWCWRADGAPPDQFNCLPLALAVCLPGCDPYNHHTHHLDPREAFQGLAQALARLRAILD